VLTAMMQLLCGRFGAERFPGSNPLAHLNDMLLAFARLFVTRGLACKRAPAMNQALRYIFLLAHEGGWEPALRTFGDASFVVPLCEALLHLFTGCATYDASNDQATFHGMHALEALTGRVPMHLAVRDVVVRCAVRFARKDFQKLRACGDVSSDHGEHICRDARAVLFNLARRDVGHVRRVMVASGEVTMAVTHTAKHNPCSLCLEQAGSDMAQCRCPHGHVFHLQCFSKAALSDPAWTSIQCPVCHHDLEADMFGSWKLWR
jgi:hypothetical protein